MPLLNLTFPVFLQGDARPHTQCATGIRPPKTVFPMIALGEKDPYYIRSNICPLHARLALLVLVEWIDLIFFARLKEIYEIITACEFFYGVGARGLIGRMARIVGEVPSHRASYWASNEDLGVLSLFFYGFAFPYSITSFQRSQEQVLSGAATSCPLCRPVRMQAV